MGKRRRPFITIIEECENKKRYIEKRKLSLLELFKEYEES